MQQIAETSDNPYGVSLRDVPAVRPTLRDLAQRFHMLDELLDEYAAQDAEPPADLLQDHAQAQRAYNDAWGGFCAENAQHSMPLAAE